MRIRLRSFPHTRHEWAAQISNRSNGSGCPYCSNQTSKPEIRIFSELMYLFDEVISRYKCYGVEIDIFVSKYNLGFEYDGSYFHKGKERKDLIKSNLLNSKNINLIRIREKPLKKLSANDLIVKTTGINKKDLDKLFLFIVPFVDNEITKKINKYIKRKTFVNEKKFREYISYFPSPFPEKSLLNLSPDLAKEWNDKKNNPLKPDNFTIKSNYKAWWICKKGHEWEATINSRTRGKGCPYCSNKKVGKENNLKVKYPKIAKEWHPKKNKNLTPRDFTYGSKKKVWWKCSRGHEWEAAISNRTSRHSGCPFCAGKRKIER